MLTWRNADALDLRSSSFGSRGSIPLVSTILARWQSLVHCAPPLRVNTPQRCPGFESLSRRQFEPSVSRYALTRVVYESTVRCMGTVVAKPLHFRLSVEVPKFAAGCVSLVLNGYPGKVVFRLTRNREFESLSRRHKNEPLGRISRARTV